MGERHDHAVHEEVDGDAVNHTRDDKLTHQKRHSPAEEVIDGGRAEGDDEVTDQAEEGGGHSAFERARTQQSGGDALQDAQRSRAKESINNERCGDVEGAGDEARPQNRARR